MFHAKANSHIYVGLGSNLGDRAGNLMLATRGILEAGFCVTRLSGIYETEPVTAEGQPLFLNMVAELSGNTSFSAEQLMARLLRVEYALGRTRSVRYSPRTIDLDLLLYKNQIRNTEYLTLPHPRLHQRRFVLVPLAELAPNLVHPVLKQSMGQLLATTDDRSEVSRWHP